MEYKSFVDNFSRVACVLSVNLKESDSNNRYLIVDANDAYKHTVVQNIEDFAVDVPYTRYIPKAKNFEDLCDSCVLNDKPIHTYFDIELYNAWMEVFLTPLSSDDPDRKLILFSYEMNPKADVDKLADVSSETSSNVIKTCLKLRETSDFQKTMDAVITDIRGQCAAKRCSILLTDFEKHEYSLLCEDFEKEPGELPMTAFLNEDFYKIIETWPRLIHKSNCFVITNESDMEEAAKIAPEWVESLKGARIKTLVIYPLRSDNKTIGYIWAGNFDPAKVLVIKETLGITAFILSAEIANEQNVRKMKIMSSTDLLTGVFNRNAMNNRISEDINGTKPIERPFGICFIDVNGLKATNDVKGHEAGDNLLKDVAKILNELKTPNCAVYRVGGDEFMIINANTGRTDFDKFSRTLLDNSELPGRAHFAVGSCHSDDTDDVIKAMQKADALMYEVKAEYYSRHPELDWHNKNA
ncbi:MAG: GGDEF domain-containing protein [Clostridiales bacterium]|nr:GGDEF domain-containing protein [Clostridiales bacterium]